jgi:hypothetical protein
MKTVVPKNDASVKNSSGASRVASQTSRMPDSGRLAQLSAMANNSPRVRKQLQLAVEMQSKSGPHSAEDLPVDANAETSAVAQRIETSEPNRTGLPDQLKRGVENLSGVALDDVQVHYNSSKPAQLNALAYAQGPDIHVGPGQEKHLPHEAWHVAQQKQGRVRPTMQMKAGIPVNDDSNLEHDADLMGAKALQTKTGDLEESPPEKPAPSSSHAPAQLFRALGTDDYELQGENEDSHFFTTQSKEPEVRRSGKGNYSIAHKIERSNEKQNLKVSDDGTMAINDTAAEAKEFYAADSVFDRSKDKLEAAESQIKLVKSGGLSLAAEGKTLSKITPEPAAEEQEEKAGEFASLVSHICIEMASGVMGNQDGYQHEAVFQSSRKRRKQTTVANISSQGTRGDKKIDRLAAALGTAGSGITHEQMREQMHSGGPEPDLPGRDYGQKSGLGQLDQTERGLGINRYAQPEIGEGFATFSVAGHKTKNIDYATGGPEIERLSNVWGYHFAGVVAKSDDKKDAITLENYNRTDDVFKQLKLVLKRLVDGNKVKIGAELAKVAPAAGDDRTEIREKLEKTLQIVRGLSADDAHQAYLKIARTYSAEQSWFFQMYGSGEGQSFHEQQAASGAFVNPLTLRVRPRDQQRETLRSAATAKIFNFPGPTGTLDGQTEFNGFDALKAACGKEIADAETEDAIRAKLSRGLFRLAAYLIQGAANLAIRLATAQGATVAPNAAQPVGAQGTIAQKATKANTVHNTCHTALQTYFGTLWFYQGQQKRNVQTALTEVAASRAFVQSTKVHYLAVR